MEKYYLAYGSNLNIEQMALRCPTAELIGTGVLRDYRLIFRFYLTIEPAEGDRVPIAVWKLDAQSEHLLDMYEGFPRFYRKEYLDVLMDDGETLNVMVYIMNEHMRKYELPSASYYTTVLLGYKHNGLNEDVLRDALVKTQKEADAL